MILGVTAVGMSFHTYQGISSTQPKGINSNFIYAKQSIVSSDHDHLHFNPFNACHPVFRGGNVALHQYLRCMKKHKHLKVVCKRLAQVSI